MRRYWTHEYCVSFSYRNESGYPYALHWFASLRLASKPPLRALTRVPVSVRALEAFSLAVLLLFKSPSSSARLW